MQPDYRTEIQGLAKQWYYAAENKMGTSEKIQLFQKTYQVIKTLEELKNRGQIEKVNELCHILIQQFKDYSIDESKILAKLDILHPKIDDGAKKLKQACKSLFQLFQLAAETPSSTPQSSILKVADMDHLLFSKLDFKAMGLLGCISKRQNEIYKSYLVELLNTGQIAIVDLGLNSITEIIDYFGKTNCSKINRLNLNGVYDLEKDYEETRSYSSEIELEENSAETECYSSEIESVNISESFPNLKHFSLDNYKPENQLDLRDLHLPHNLESLSLSDCFVDDLSFIKNFKSLERLDLSNNNLGDKDVTFLKKLSSLKEIDIYGNSITDLNILKNNSKLVSLNIKFNKITDISVIKEFPVLERLSFGYPLGAISTAVANQSLLAHMHVLKECPSLTSLDISSESPIENKFLNSLELPNLKHLALTPENCNFLSNCPSLESIACKFDDLSPLENCNDLKKLVIQAYTADDLDILPILINLEEIEIVMCSVKDLSALKKLPALKKVTIEGCWGISKEHMEALTNKGIIVKKN